jgi:sugar phosphate isomerase/epimerase
MKALGAECTEVNVGMNLECVSLFHPGGKYTLATDDGIHLLKDDLASSGCRISAFMMANRLDEQLDKELEWTRKLVPAAHALGVEVIRIDVVPRKLEGDKFLPFAISACKHLCQIAEGTPVRFGVENHGKITNDPQFLQSLFDGVGSPKLGLTLDCANFYWWGHPVNDLYPIYEKFAPRVVHTHCKSIKYPEDKKNVKRDIGWEYGKYNCPIYEGDIEFARVIKILRQANYRGDLCVEDESLGKYPASEQADVLRKEIALLKKLAAPATTG